MLNVDVAVAGPDLRMRGVPSLRDLMLESAGAVTDVRSGRPLRDIWLDAKRKEWAASSPLVVADPFWQRPIGAGEPLPAPRDFTPHLDWLGSGSDYTAFLDHLGVPSLDLGFSGKYGVYHSNYDDFNWMEKFGDPEFLTHAMAARLYTVVLMRAANAEVLPFRFVPYAEAFREHVDELRLMRLRNDRKSGKPGATPNEVFGGLADSVLRYHAEARRLDLALDSLAAKDGARAEALEALNAELTRLERAFLLPGGLDGRPWFKHAVYAPGVTTGYASWPLPAIREAIEMDKPDALKEAVAQDDRRHRRGRPPRSRRLRPSRSRPRNPSQRPDRPASVCDRAVSPGRRFWLNTTFDRSGRRRACSGSPGRRIPSRMNALRPSHPTADTLPRVLGPVTALCVVVGSVIGSGIFIVPASVAKEVPFLGGIIAVWIIGGVFSAAGALTMAELGAMMPQAGGPYVYLREAYGPIPAFLFGWSEFTVSRAGSMATLAAAFARYFIQIVPPPSFIGGAVWQAAAAIAAITIVTIINIMGTRSGGGLQVVGTVVKVGGVLGLIALPFFVTGGSVDNLGPIWPERIDGSIFAGVMAAMVGILWAYDGWMNVTPLAEEIKEPEKNIPRAMIWGMAVLVALYLAVTLAYHYVLPMAEMAAADEPQGGIEKAVAAVYCKALLGGYGVIAISALVMCSTFISLNGNALTGPRSYFAIARDGMLPNWFKRVHPRFQTPASAIFAQGVWAIILTALGTALVVVPPPQSDSGLPQFFSAAWRTLNKTPLYDILRTYVIFGATIFYMLAITSVFVLRVKRPDLPRPYRTWGYPFTPLLFVVGSCVLLADMLRNEQSRGQAVAGGALILLGLPVYYWFRRPAPSSRFNPLTFATPPRSRVDPDRGATRRARVVSSDRSAGRGSANTASARLFDATSAASRPSASATRFMNANRLSRSRPPTCAIPS